MRIDCPQTLHPRLCWQSRRCFNHFGALHKRVPIRLDHGALEGNGDRIAIVRFWEDEYPALKRFADVVEIYVKAFML